MSEAGNSSFEHSVESGLKRSNEEDSGDEVVTKKLKTQDLSVSDAEPRETSEVVLEEHKLEPTLPQSPKEEEKPAEVSQNVGLDTKIENAENESVRSGDENVETAAKIENAENGAVKSGDENVETAKETNSQGGNEVNEHGKSSEGDLTSTEIKDGESYLPTEAPPPLIQVLNPIRLSSEILPRVDPRGPTEASNNALPPGIECGVVKWYDITKGFGFIQRESGDDVFIHSTALPPRPGQRGLADKEPVWFKVTKEPQGRLRAYDITGPHGAPLRGVPDSALLSGGFGAPLQHAPVLTPTAPMPPTNPSDFPPHTTTPLPPNRQRGFAKWFNIQKGFGFIAPEDGTEDVFCHQSNLLCVEGAFRSLAEKENLEFEILNEPNQGKAKRKAINVTGPGGRPVIGVPRPVDPAFPGSSSQVPMSHSARPFQPPILGSRGVAPFGPPGLPQAPEARSPADYAYYSQYMAAHGHPPQQPQPHSYQHPQYPQQQQHQYQQQYQQQMQQQYQQNPEHAAAWAAYYAAQAAAQGQPAQQPSEASGQQSQSQPDQQQTAEHQAAWQAYYAQVAALQAQQQAQ